MQSRIRWSAPLAACLLCSLLYPARTRPALAEDRPTARVVVYRGNLRDLPHLDNSHVLRVLRQDDVVLLRGRLPDSSWYAVTTADGLPGWMHHSLLALPAVPLPTLVPGDPGVPTPTASPLLTPTTRPTPTPTPTLPGMVMDTAPISG